MYHITGVILPLPNFSGLNNLNYIDGYLEITNNCYLSDFSGWNNLDSIGDYFEIDDNDALTSLSSLQNITSVEGTLEISTNNALYNLTGLENIGAGSITDLYIYSNKLLTKCAVESICNFLTSPGGTISIHNNAPGCNPQKEVQEACGASVNEVQNSHKILLHPIPFNSSTTIEYELGKPAYVKLFICNYLGELTEILVDKYQMKDKYKFIWCPENLPAGIYFCILKIDDETQTEKMIKLQ